METLGRIALWVMGLFAMLIGVCMIVGVDPDNMLWTVMSKPLGCVVCYASYKLMVWSGFSEPINDTEEA